jgi:hypothetical protein
MPDPDESLYVLPNSRDVSHQPRQTQGGTSGSTQTVLTAKKATPTPVGITGQASLIAWE